MIRTDTFLFADCGDIPNHPRWPMIVYARAIDPAASDPAVAFERMFERHGWGDGWRNGIFPFAHFHSNAHEALGIAAGRARVRFGGGAGSVLDVAAGDSVLLPAGTGHQLVWSSPDLLVIGAYPRGPRRDLMRAGEGDGQAIRMRIAAVARPDTDPVAGARGPMTVFWE
jgi:uncharacterized protein YjlB